MRHQRHANDFGLMYMNEIGARIVAETGREVDRFHLGKLILRGLKDAPEFLLQIDGSTDESETFASVLDRSVRCAISMRNLGLQCGDVIVLMAPNHVDLNIPFYAALFLGITIAAVDRTLTVNEIKSTFAVDKPKAIFCQSEKSSDIQQVLDDLAMEGQIITFDKEDSLCSFTEFLEKFGDENASVEDFQPADFDPEDTVALLIATSGTTGLPKAAAATHKNFAITGPYWLALYPTYPTPTQMVLVGSPLQWLTALFHFLFSPILRYTRLQSTLPLNREHAYHLINTYRPTFAILSPTLTMNLIKLPERLECDFSCFEIIMLGGSATPPDIFEQFKAISPDTEVYDVYGMSELTSIGFQLDDPPAGSCGKPLGCFQYRLVNIETLEDVTEPHEQGELWVKGPGIFKEYKDNPVATEETFGEDRWFRTGDIFYRDENWNFFFVERYKLLLKFMSHHISPVELENFIRQHPGVQDVAVTGLPDPECGDLAVACVVRNPDLDVTADEIKALVKDTLTDSKQLRGGVIFVDDIPMTASTKIHRRRLREIALEMERE